ncbi:hypothetical protein [Chloroflexus sp.]|uniref:hypothetical protein n=1 Tax=Chloroflexus sp. TaxID=1904827 RepID=UPI00263430F7|nr:hypothetical protein [uncultured Chloroflexus sp.]
MRGIGRLLRVLLRGPERTFGCLVFFLGGFSLAVWPLAGIGPILALVTLLTIVTGLTLFWRDAGWFRRLWGGGLMLAVAAAVIALLNPDTPHGALFRVVAWLSLLPALAGVVAVVVKQWQAGKTRQDRTEATEALSPAPRFAPEPPLPTSTSVSPLEPVSELPPPLSHRPVRSDRQLLDQLLSVPPEQGNGD